MGADGHKTLAGAPQERFMTNDTGCPRKVSRMDRIPIHLPFAVVTRDPVTRDGTFRHFFVQIFDAPYSIGFEAISE